MPYAYVLSRDQKSHVHNSCPLDISWTCCHIHTHAHLNETWNDVQSKFSVSLPKANIIVEVTPGFRVQNKPSVRFIGYPSSSWLFCCTALQFNKTVDMIKH